MQVLSIDWMWTYSNLSQIDEVSGGYVEKEMATHSSTLAWKIPWTEEPGRLQSMGLLESDTTERLHFHFHASEKEMAPHPSILAWRIPGTEEPGGLPSMRSHRVGHNWSDLAAVAAAAGGYGSYNSIIEFQVNFCVWKMKRWLITVSKVVVEIILDNAVRIFFSRCHLLYRCEL